MVKIDWTRRRLLRDDTGHVLVKDWPQALRAFLEIVTHFCGAGGRKLIVWDEDKNKLVFSFQ